MAGYSTLPRVDRIRVSSPTAHDRRSALRTAATAGFVVAGLQYLVIETATASAWTSPAYSYATNFVSDLGVPARGTFEGRAIDSPLHAVMNTGFVIQGVLFLTVGVIPPGSPSASRSTPSSPGSSSPAPPSSPAAARA